MPFGFKFTTIKSRISPNYTAIGEDEFVFLGFTKFYDSWQISLNAVPYLQLGLGLRCHICYKVSYIFVISQVIGRFTCFNVHVDMWGCLGCRLPHLAETYAAHCDDHNFYGSISLLSYSVSQYGVVSYFCVCLNLHLKCMNYANFFIFITPDIKFHKIH